MDGAHATNNSLVFHRLDNHERVASALACLSIWDICTSGYYFISARQLSL